MLNEWGLNILKLTLQILEQAHKTMVALEEGEVAELISEAKEILITRIKEAEGEKK